MKKTLQFLLFFVLSTTLHAQTNICDELTQILKPKSVKRNMRILTTTDDLTMTADIDTVGNMAMNSKTTSFNGETTMEMITMDSKMYMKIKGMDWTERDLPSDPNRVKDMTQQNIMGNAATNCKKLDAETIDNVSYRVFSYEVDMDKVKSNNRQMTITKPIIAWIAPNDDIYKVHLTMQAKGRKEGEMRTMDMTMVYTYDIPINIQAPQVSPQNKLSTTNLDSLPQLKRHSPSTDGVYTIVEQQPEFPGGQRELFKYLQSNTKYPAEARQKGIKGTVYIGFVIDTDGSIKDIGIKRGLSKDINEEALRVIASMPKWIPGMDQGKVVKVAYTLPISFKM
jgi:TonB family protein